MKHSLDELLHSLETIRSEKYPDIPADVIKKIVTVQAENMDDPTRRATETERIIDNYLNSLKQEGGPS